MIQHEQSVWTLNSKLPYARPTLVRKEISQENLKALQKNLLLSDNCKVHKACNIQAVIQECGLTELRHPSYSPDLAPYDFFLFKKLKKKKT
jgi:transposase